MRQSYALPRENSRRKRACRESPVRALAGAVYEGVNKLQNEKSDVPSSAESRGVAHLLMGAGVVLVNKYDGIGPAPPRLRVLGGFATSFFIAHPPLLC